MLDSQKCPLYYLIAPADHFGCSLQDNELSLPPYAQTIIDAHGDGLDAETEARSPMLALMMKEGHRRALNTPVIPTAIAKRGLCTFVERGRLASMQGSGLALVVNTDNTLAEMPQGKEKLDAVTAAVGILKESDGNSRIVVLLL